MNGERWTLDGLIAQSPPRDCEFVLAAEFDALEAELKDARDNMCEFEPADANGNGDGSHGEHIITVCTACWNRVATKASALEAALREGLKAEWTPARTAFMWATEVQKLLTPETGAKADATPEG